MYIVSAFEVSSQLELLISELETKGFTKEEILAIPLDHKESAAQIIDTMSYSDGKSLMDGTAIAGTIGMVLGSIYGFVLTWGPIIWGLIGLLAGGYVGYVIDKWRHKPSAVWKGDKARSEVFLMLNCKAHVEHEDQIKNMLWRYGALGVSKLFQGS